MEPSEEQMQPYVLERIIRNLWSQWILDVISWILFWRAQLNYETNEQINYDIMNYREIIHLADGYKKSQSFTMAIKAYEKAIEKTGEVKEIKYILPRITSCYRKDNRPDDAIALYTKICSEYGYDILDSVLLTSVSAAYIDIGEYVKAKKCADRAYAMSQGNISDELKSVYARLKKYNQ